MIPRPISEVLAEARAGYERVDAAGAVAAVEGGGLLVDIRPVGLRQRDGEVPGALIVDRNQLEWRLDPASDHRLAVIDETAYERPVVLMCDEGFASSLAAVSLRTLGMSGATDVEGGFQAWRADGRPVTTSGVPSPPSPVVGAPASPAG